jgi:hypothetical protein
MRRNHSDFLICPAGIRSRRRWCRRRGIERSFNEHLGGIALEFQIIVCVLDQLVVDFVGSTVDKDLRIVAREDLIQVDMAFAGNVLVQGRRAISHLVYFIG